MFDSYFVPFKLHYAEMKNLDVGDPVYSETVSAGGHLWRIRCHPHGDNEDNNVSDDDVSDDEDGEAANFLSIYLELMSNARGVKAIFEAFVMKKNGESGSPGSPRNDGLLSIFSHKNSNSASGWSHFMEQSDLESFYVVDGWVTIVWGVIVVSDDTLSVLHSNIGSHLSQLLDCAADGSDVSFVVGGETFPVHRAVLAARSPVFKAELFGSMAEASMSRITLEDITPATFRVFLRFIYTDALPEDDDSTIEMYKHLLAVADRYAMDRLKLMCAKKLWDDVSVDTVSETLSYAETYSCAELKSNCIAFFIDEENFMDAALTNGYAALVHKFPEIIDELKKKATLKKRRAYTGVVRLAKMFDSCFVPFKLHYAEMKYSDAIYSETVYAGGHLWRIRCNLHGDTDHEDGEAASFPDYLSIYLELMSNARGVKAIFEVFVMDKNGEPVSHYNRRLSSSFSYKNSNSACGWSHFMWQSDRESLYVVDGWVTIVWGVIVVCGSDPLTVPSSDIGIQLGRILDCTDNGSDVSFVIGGETFLAHRAVLAARSPVFKAELFGSMVEASMSHITLEDITPATFKVFLRFIYTDALPQDDQSTIEMYTQLLAMADRYAMDRLKLMCAKKLWDDVSVDTVAETLSYAETYSCAELKSKCSAFIIDERTSWISR